MNRKSLVSVVATTIMLALIGSTLCFAQAPAGESAARQEKNARYNGGQCDLTSSQDCIEQYEPRALPIIPLKESTVAVVGQVTSVESYLSADRTHIYSESILHVEEILKKPDESALSPNQTLVLDQIGGSLRTPNGQALHDNTRSGFRGKLRVGGRYVLFLVPTHDGKDMTPLTAYELRDGKVFRLTEDGSPSSVLMSKFSKEANFLRALRRKAQAPGVTAH